MSSEVGQTAIVVFVVCSTALTALLNVDRVPTLSFNLVCILQISVELKNLIYVGTYLYLWKDSTRR